jgi:hypothetical protein
MFIRRKRGLLSRVVPILAIAGIAQSFMKRRGQKTGAFRKLIGTASIAALAMQKNNSSRFGRRW